MLWIPPACISADCKGTISYHHKFAVALLNKLDFDQTRNDAHSLYEGKSESIVEAINSLEIAENTYFHLSVGECDSCHLYESGDNLSNDLCEKSWEECSLNPPKFNNWMTSSLEEAIRANLPKIIRHLPVFAFSLSDKEYSIRSQYLPSQLLMLPP